MSSNNIVNFPESTTISNVCTKKSGNVLNAPRKKKENYRNVDENIDEIQKTLMTARKIALVLWVVQIEEEQLRI